MGQPPARSRWCKVTAIRESFLRGTRDHSSRISRAPWSCSQTAIPEDARGLLDPVLERMLDAVHHYKGTVNEVRDDGIMALFDAPLLTRIMRCAHVTPRSGCRRR